MISPISISLVNRVIFKEVWKRKEKENDNIHSKNKGKCSMKWKLYTTNKKHLCQIFIYYKSTT